MLTQEQIAERVNYIGASDAAAALGMSRWGSPLTVWAEKTGLIKPEDISQKLPVKLGHKLEQTVAELFMEETGKKVHRVNETVYHPQHPFIGCNLDRRVVGERAILECKTCSPWKAKEWEGEEFPTEYVVQVMHQLAVTGADRGYLAVLIGNQDFKVKVIERDEKALSDLVKREVEFWEKFVVPKLMPEVITKNDRDTLTTLFPNAQEGKVVILSDQANAIAESLEAMRSDMATLKGQIEGAQNALIAMIGDAEAGRTDTYEITWGNHPVRRMNMERFKEERPDVYEAYRESKNERQFSLKRIELEEANGESN